jgi:hypothetical protein
MPGLWWLIPALLVVGIIGLLLAWRPLRGLFREIQMEKAREMFALQREHLEAKFMDLAAATGKPRGLRWRDCDWESEVEFARDKQTGALLSLVGVAIYFAAIEGSDMEDNPNVATPRSATAVFQFNGRHWQVGRTLFNMNPDEALLHFKGQYERVELM